MAPPPGDHGGEAVAGQRADPVDIVAEEGRKIDMPVPDPAIGDGPVTGKVHGRDAGAGMLQQGGGLVETVAHLVLDQKKPRSWVSAILRPGTPALV